MIELITKEILNDRYSLKGLTDDQISEEFGYDRTYIVKLRKKYNIRSRKSTGRIGEELALSKLEDIGFSVRDMNKISETYPFDIYVNESIRLDVKTSYVTNSGSYGFILTEKKSNGNIPSDYRIVLPNGRTKKLLQKSCDFVLCVCMSDKNTNFYVIPSDVISDTLQTLRISPTGKYSMYLDRWDLLR